MKPLCCNKFFLLFLTLVGTLYASIHDKSAILYVGEKISYPMVGIHDYIIVDPKNTNPYTHGFNIYKDKIYARILIDQQLTQEQLSSQTKKILNQGFHNFFFDFQTEQKSQELSAFFSKLKLDIIYKNSKIIVHLENRLLLKRIVPYIDTLLIYNGSKSDNELHVLNKEIIDVETDSSSSIEAIKSLGYIPYITNTAMTRYGISSKNALKREVLTLITEKKHDKSLSSAHQYGALPLEYHGYIQQLHNVEEGLPDTDHLDQYAGVVLWLSENYEESSQLLQWIKEVKNKHIPIVLAYTFGFSASNSTLNELEISAYDGNPDAIKTISIKDPMLDYEMQAPINQETLYLIPPKGSKELLTYTDNYNSKSTLAAITPWGGYAIGESFFIEFNEENIWVINPFKFFKEALRLKDIPVPDPSTENGSRLFFTHIDGDGILNGVEFNSELLAGDIIYSEILQKYPVPHSVSVIGAEIMQNGLYPQKSQRLSNIAKQMFALENVEPATHTFSHPFFWGEVTDNQLRKEYRLQPKEYQFSLEYETLGMLDYIDNNISNNTKKANMVFWSGDCNPRKNALELLAKNNILSINGGYTTINQASPWLTLVSPLGLIRDEYYQIYTGAQNENVFTNDWLGPFWGFKKVIQTFELTNSPKRLKPIDVYYHLYSGSKKASLNALRYVFDWVLEQENIMPIYTSEYIPKAMDYFSASIAQDNRDWLVSGMNSLKTLRLEKKASGADMNTSKTVIGVQHFEDHTYISLDQHKNHIFKTQNSQNENIPYLSATNGKILEYINKENNKIYKLEAHVPLELTFNLPETCVFKASPIQENVQHKDGKIHIAYNFSKKATIDVRCE